MCGRALARQCQGASVGHGVEGIVHEVQDGTTQSALMKTR